MQHRILIYTTEDILFYPERWIFCTTGGVYMSIVYGDKFILKMDLRVNSERKGPLLLLILFLYIQ